MEKFRNADNSDKYARFIKKAALPIVFILIFNRMFTNYCLTAKQAMRNNAFFERNFSFITEVKNKPFSISVYEGETQYRTYIAEYSFPFWTSRVSTYVDKTDDKLQTIGGGSYNNLNKSRGFFSLIILNNDENAAYIRAGGLGQDVIKEIPVGEIVAFYWDNPTDQNNFSAVAYSAKNEPLYEYKTEIIYHGGGVASSNGSKKWMPIE